MHIHLAPGHELGAEAVVHLRHQETRVTAFGVGTVIARRLQLANAVEH